MRANKLREIWASGKAATNCWLMLPGGPFAAELLAHQGWDSLTVDMQHGLIGYDAMLGMLTAISTTGATPLMRVASHEPGAIGRALDAGAYGVIVPMVETREQCEAFIQACRYTPLGNRSYGPIRASLYSGQDFSGYAAKANETVLAIAQIENQKGLDNIEAIAAVKGLDMLYLGPGDMMLSLGRLPDRALTDQGVLAAADKIVATARKYGLRTGVYCNSVEEGHDMVARGFDLVTVVSDLGLLSAGGGLQTAY